MSMTVYDDLDDCESSHTDTSKVGMSENVQYHNIGTIQAVLNDTDCATLRSS